MEAKVPELSTSGRKCNSSGSVRKLKDNAADWHNLIMKWDRLNNDGSSIATKIVNIGLNRDPQKQTSLTVDGLDDSAPSNSEKAFALTNQELDEECRKLMIIVDKMTHIVSKMEKLLSSEKAICELETFQYGTVGRLTPLFHTWQTSQFAEVSSKLYESYKQEVALKQIILQELAHTTNPDLSMVYLSSWLHQPYIDDKVKLLLESLLLETGHRPV